MPPRTITKHSSKRLRTPSNTQSPSSSLRNLKRYHKSNHFQDEVTLEPANLPLAPCLTETQSKYRGAVRGLMCPSGPALSHPAASILLNFAHEGCPAEPGSDWHLDLLVDEAVRRRAHPSAQEPAHQSRLYSQNRPGIKPAGLFQKTLEYASSLF
jgi:hypothetical protein